MRSAGSGIRSEQRLIVTPLPALGPRLTQRAPRQPGDGKRGARPGRERPRPALRVLPTGTALRGPRGPNSKVAFVAKVGFMAKVGFVADSVTAAPRADSRRIALRGRAGGAASGAQASIHRLPSVTLPSSLCALPCGFVTVVNVTVATAGGVSAPCCFPCADPHVAGRRWPSSSAR